MGLKNEKNKRFKQQKFTGKKNLKGRFKSQRLKKILINNLIINGKRLKSEKNLNRNLKELQKTDMKPYKLLFQKAIQNSTPAFRIIELRKKNKRKKNQVREIPTFLSCPSFRVS